MSPILLAACLTTRSFPRVSGDEPRIETKAPKNELFSPRERG